MTYFSRQSCLMLLFCPRENWRHFRLMWFDEWDAFQKFFPQFLHLVLVEIATFLIAVIWNYCSQCIDGTYCVQDQAFLIFVVQISFLYLLIIFLILLFIVLLRFAWPSSRGRQRLEILRWHRNTAPNHILRMVILLWYERACCLVCVSICGGSLIIQRVHGVC